MGKDPSKPFEYDQELNLPHLNYDVARSHSNEYFIFAPNSKMGSQEIDQGLFLREHILLSIVRSQVLMKLQVQDPNSIYNLGNKTIFVKREMILCKNQVIMFDFFEVESKSYCCMGVLEIKNTTAEIVYYDSISDVIDFKDFSLVSDKAEKAVYIVGGKAMDNSKQVTSIFQLDLEGIMPNVEVRSILKDVGTLRK